MNQRPDLVKTANEFFERLLNMPPTLDIRRRYALIDNIFHLSVDTILKDSSVYFTGFFSKVDFLIKLHSSQLPDFSLYYAINGLRVRLHSLAPAGRSGEEEENQPSMSNWHIDSDIAALGRFIALIYDVPLPERLASRYHLVRQKDYHPLLDKGRTLRVIVVSVGDFIEATREDIGEKCRVAFACEGNGYVAEDREYLRKLLQPGVQINLVRPRADYDGVIYPQYIIVEPDFLVDISSIAACFDDYGTPSPYSYFLNKLKPQVQSEPIILGNFASQLLDETVYGRFHDIRESFGRFARKNALAIASCQLGPAFLAKAEEQEMNIQHAMKALAESGKNPSESILEPSFFSETLGIQGRMDYLQLDYSTVVEQKSGKGAFNPQDDTKPVKRTSHYVQVLLYRALLDYGNYVDNKVSTFLLYSKYSESLLAVGNAPKLVFQALRLRNQIAWFMLWLSRGTNITMLSKLTPERVRPKGSGFGWEHFIRPQLSLVLDPIKSASPLERAYYYRFLRFVMTEHVLSKLGNRTKEGSGFASTWNDSLRDRLAAGNIYDHMTIQSFNRNDDDQVGSVVFSFPQRTDSDTSNFRQGDIVMFYSYDPGIALEPLATRHMVFRGTISEITSEYIVIELRNPQTDGRVFRGRIWAVEHDFMESSTNSLFRGVQAFLTSPLSRRQLLLGQRKPETAATYTLQGDYTDPATGNKEFNELVLRSKQARDYFLIIGPPGTGKTSFGMLNVLKEELLDKDSSVLLMAYTNRAVDEICQKITDAGIDYIRIGSESGCAKRFRDHLLDSKVDNCHTISDIKKLIMTTRVFCGTTTAFNSGISLLQQRTFSLAIVDEASQILEPQIVGILSAKCNDLPSVQRFVLIGDEKQLPAVVQQSAEASAVTDKILNDASITDCRMSLFERLIRRSHHDGTDADIVYMLTRQGRMHPVIADFPSRAFYDGRLQVVPLPHQQETTGDEAPLRMEMIVYTPPKDEEWLDKISDKTNLREASIIANIAFDVWKSCEGSFNPLKSLGIIVPYRNQVATIRSAIELIERNNGISGLSDISIDTVERYQGSQRDVIIYGFTVTRNYQLDFLTDNQYVDPSSGKIIDRKLNVALTRGMKRLVVIGDKQVLSANVVFRELIAYCREHNCLTDLDDDK